MKTATLIFGGFLALLTSSLKPGPPPAGDSTAALATRTKHAIELNGSPSTVLGGILWQTGVPGGVAEVSTCHDEAKLQLRVPEGTTLQNALQELVALNASYKWSIQNGVVNLLPTRGIPDLLHARVATYESDSGVNKFAPSAVLFELLALPEMRAREARFKLEPGLYTGGPGAVCGKDCDQKQPPSVRVSIKDTSLLEAFNFTVSAYGHTIWSYTETECNGKKTFLIETLAD